MNCPHWEERIALYAGGDQVSVDVEQHMAECEACCDFCSQIRETLDTLRGEHQVEIDPVHYTAVRTGVLAQIRCERTTWKRLAWLSGVGIAAALLLGIALRPAPLPAPPARVAIYIPNAPLVQSVAQPAPAVQHKTAPRQPMLVKLQTTDPKIIIYWIAD
jgi:hypothetical protein